jgi:sugar-specific transcriptional regulator TrmB
MSAREITELEEFGLTALQSRVYVALLRLGASRPSRISSQIGIARPEAYRILRELYVKGIVERNAGSPSTYTGIVPERALSILLDRTVNRLRTLELKKRSLANSLKSQSLLNQHTNTRFSVIAGGTNVIALTNELIKNAKHTYDAIFSKTGLARIQDPSMPDAPVADAILTARKHKVRIRAIAEIDDSNSRAADFLSRYVELRQITGLTLYVDIIDNQQIVFGPAMSMDEALDASPREADVWTNDPRFIAGMHALFQTLWNASSRYHSSRSRRKSAPRPSLLGDAI